MDGNKHIGIGRIGNYYGGLCVMEKDGKYYWLIEKYNTDFDDMDDWDEIPKSLYDELIKHHEGL
jgi:hypothetical protein